MTWEVFLAIGLGVVATHVTNLIKRRWPSLGSRETQAVVFGVCFVAAVVTTLVMKYAPPELLATLATSFAGAIGYYETVVKEHKK